MPLYDDAIHICQTFKIRNSFFYWSYLQNTNKKAKQIMLALVFMFGTLINKHYVISFDRV